MPLTQQTYSENSQPQASVQPNSPNPFSLVWSKVAPWFQVAQSEDQPEATETQSFSEPSAQEQDLYPHVADRVDPSFYYAIFFMPYY